MTEAERGIYQHIAILSTLRGRMRHTRPPAWRYDSPEAVLLTHGKFWTSVDGPLPRRVKRGRLGDCFANAGRYVHTTSYTYCEGYGGRIIPTWHGWLVDEFGTVIDPTWRPSRDERASDWPYFGIAFDGVYLSRRLLQQQVWGLLYNDEAMMLDDPAQYLSQAHYTATEQLTSITMDKENA